MNRKILEWPHTVLRQVSPPAVIGSDLTTQVIEDLTDTFRVVQGYGLAAPQIGHSTRILVVSPRALGFGDEEQLLMINPELTNLGEMDVSREACFSVPEITATLKRPSSCTVDFQDESGEKCTIDLVGLPAFCAQHEIDHLDGKTTLDRVGRMSKSLLLKKRKKAREERAKIEAEYQREFLADQEIYSDLGPSKKKRVSKTSKARKIMQRRSRKKNFKKSRKK